MAAVKYDDASEAPRAIDASDLRAALQVIGTLHEVVERLDAIALLVECLPQMERRVAALEVARHD
jgi:hypothetical protein